MNLPAYIKKKVKEPYILMDSDVDNKKDIECNMEQPDIVQARKVEPFYTIFRLFSIKDQEIITLCIAAFRTLARNTSGFFTRVEIDSELNYIPQAARSKVFRTLQQYEWIICNGINYEIPERVRYFQMLMVSALTCDGEDYGKMIGVSAAITDIDDAAGNDEDTSNSNFEISLGTLRRIHAELVRVLERKSPAEARVALHKSANIRAEIEKIEKRLKKKNRIKYQYTLTTAVHQICAKIINLHTDLLDFIHKDIQSNARSFGQYLTPEQITEFLHKCSLDKMSRIVEKRFSSVHEMNFISRDEIIQRGLSYLRRVPELQELTPPPPVVEIQKKELIIQHQDSYTSNFYEVLMDKLSEVHKIPLKEVVVKSTFGDSLYNTGLLVTVRYELASVPDKPQFDIVLEDTFEELSLGPVDRITEGIVKLNLLQDEE